MNESLAPAAELLPVTRSTSAGLMPTNYAEAVEMAKHLAKGNIVPAEYRGNIADCLIALDMAMRLNCSPLMVMQSLVVIHGRPSWSATFLIATVNQSGRFDALDYEIEGNNPKDDNYRVRAFARERRTGDVKRGEWIDWGIVKAEGWDKRKGSKWLTIPGQMFRYRAASWFTRAYCPDLSMGLPTRDEVIDMGPAVVVDKEAEAGAVDALLERVPVVGSDAADNVKDESPFVDAKPVPAEQTPGSGRHPATTAVAELPKNEKKAPPAQAELVDVPGGKASTASGEFFADVSDDDPGFEPGAEG